MFISNFVVRLIGHPQNRCSSILQRHRKVGSSHRKLVLMVEGIGPNRKKISNAKMGVSKNGVNPQNFAFFF